MKVMNTTDQVKEIIIDIKFGYSGYDSLGNYAMISGDTLPEAKYSAVPFVKVFPKRLLLQPKEEQVIRFMLGNTSELKDGTYFGKIHILSKDPPQEIDTTYTETISARLEIHFTLVSALFIEKGEKNCSLKTLSKMAYADSSFVYVVVGFEKEGNSPFLGTSEVIVFDSEGNVVAEKKELSPIYFSAKRAYKFEKKNFKKGKYKVNLIMSNEHKDVPDKFKIPFKTLNETFFVDLESDI